MYMFHTRFVRRAAWVVPVVSLIVVCSRQAAAQTCAVPPTDILAWWTLDDGAGIVAPDTAAVPPATSLGAVHDTGNVAGALRFNGVDSYAFAADSPTWAFGSRDFTIEFWANLDREASGDFGHPADVFIANDEGP